MSLKNVQTSQQACSGYSQGTLQGNWFEERLSLKQPFRDITKRKIRERDDSIGLIADNGVLLPLRRVSRNSSWQTKENIPDDNFREYKTSNQVQYEGKILENFQKTGDCRNIIKREEPKRDYPIANTVSMLTGKTNSYHIVNRNTIRQIERERAANNTAGTFGSCLPKHPEGHDKMMNLTSYQCSFSRPLKDTPSNLNQYSIKLETQPAGRRVDEQRIPSVQRKRLLAVQVGEKLQDDQNDPKYNTSQQRSWVPMKQTGLDVSKDNLGRSRSTQQNREEKGYMLDTFLRTTSQRQSFDNATSLPIGEGEFSSLPKRTNTPGEFRKIHTDITRREIRSFSLR